MDQSFMKEKKNFAISIVDVAAYGYFNGSKLDV